MKEGRDTRLSSKFAESREENLEHCKQEISGRTFLKYQNQGRLWGGGRPRLGRVDERGRDRLRLDMNGGRDRKYVGGG